MKISYHAGMTAPYCIMHDGQLVGGLIKDIGDRLSRDLGLKVTYVPIAAARSDSLVESGAINIRPFTSPQWMAGRELYYWTTPIVVEQKAFLIRKASQVRIRSLDNVKGLRIGGILGYQYPEFATIAQSFTRDDVETLRQNIDRLAAGRIDAVYDSELYMLYLLKDSPDMPFAVEPFRPAPVPMSWAVAKNAALPFERMDALIKRMLADKTIDNMLAKYRP